MLGTHDLLLFILSGLLLNITPGADSLYIVARSVSQGSRAGMAAAFGIGPSLSFSCPHRARIAMRSTLRVGLVTPIL